MTTNIGLPSNHYASTPVHHSQCIKEANPLDFLLFLSTIRSRVRALPVEYPWKRPALILFSDVMAIKRSQKKTLITKHRTHAKDTGSPQVQIAILTKQIKLLTEHLKDHKKDQSARRGLLAKVAKRRKLLTYLKMNKPTDYQGVLESHKLKK